MCFYHDAPEWHAEIYEDSIVPGCGEVGCCLDCESTITADEPRRHVFMQQYEECQNYTWDNDAGEFSHPTTECEDGCDLGESDEFELCLPCCAVRTAIKALEHEEGCGPGEDEPYFGGLYEALDEDAERNEGGERIGPGKYARKVLEWYPQIGAHLRDHLGVKGV